MNKLKKYFKAYLCIIFIFAILVMPCLKTQATDSGWVTKGTKRYYIKNGKCVKGLKKIGKYTYYFDSKGIMKKNKWIRFENIKRYFNAKGHMVKNKVVDLRKINKKGIYEIGKREEVEKIAKKWVKAAIKADGGKHSKLRACYNYMKCCSYASVKMEEPTAETKYNGWDIDCAKRIFVTKQGNCYCFASAFAFMARQLGYDAKVVVGTASKINGEVNKHAWVEIKGKIYDPEREYSVYHPYGVYGKSYLKAPYVYVKDFSI